MKKRLKRKLLKQKERRNYLKLTDFSLGRVSYRAVMDELGIDGNERLFLIMAKAGLPMPTLPVRDEFLSEEDLDLRNLTQEEFDAWYDLWLRQAQATNDADEHIYSHGVFAGAELLGWRPDAPDEDEAERTQRCPGIDFADGVTGRRARIVGTGLEVWEVVSTWQHVEGSWEKLKTAYDWLFESQLQSALAYYKAYPEEIDALIRANDEAFRKHHE